MTEENMTEYTTPDLFRGAAIVAMTKLQPDELIVVNGNLGAKEKKIIMRWAQVPLSLVGKLESGLLRICPLQLAKSFIPLKRRVLTKLDESRGQDEPAKKTD